MIRKAVFNDLAILTRLASALWSDCPKSTLGDELSSALSDSDCAFFIAYSGKHAVGFAECGLRHDYVEGTDSSPVGYLEGIYIEFVFYILSIFFSLYIFISLSRP